MSRIIVHTIVVVGLILPALAVVALVVVLVLLLLLLLLLALALDPVLLRGGLLLPPALVRCIVVDLFLLAPFPGGPLGAPHPPSPSCGVLISVLEVASNLATLL